MNSQPRRAVDQLTRSDVPTSPGIYAWYREGKPVYSGRADRIRRPERSSLGQPPPDRQRLVPFVVPQERLRAPWYRIHGQDDHPPNRHDGRGGGAGQPMGARV